MTPRKSWTRYQPTPQAQPEPQAWLTWLIDATCIVIIGLSAAGFVYLALVH